MDDENWNTWFLDSVANMVLCGPGNLILQVKALDNDVNKGGERSLLFRRLSGAFASHKITHTICDVKSLLVSSTLALMVACSSLNFINLT